MVRVKRQSLNKYEGRNYTFSAKKFASSSAGGLKPRSASGHSIAVRATHSFAVGGDAARMGVCG